MEKKVVVKRIAVSLAALVLAYTLAGFLVVPRTAEWFINTRLGEILGRPVRVGDVRFDPWRLAAEADMLTVGAAGATGRGAGKAADPDIGPGATLLSVKQIRVNLSVASIFRLSLVVTDAVVDSPQFHLERNPDNSLNISDLIHGFSGETASQSQPDNPPRGRAVNKFRLANLRLTNGRITFVDHVTGRVHHADNVFLELPLISGLGHETHIPAEASLEFKLNGAGVAIKLTALPFAPGTSAHLDVSATDLALAPYLPYLSPPPALAVSSPGRLNAGFSVDYQGQGEQLPKISISGRVGVTDVSAGIQTPETSGIMPLVDCPELTADVAIDDLLTRGVSIRHIRVNRPTLHLERTADGRFRLQELLDRSPETPELAMPGPTGTDFSPIPLDIGLVEITDAAMSFRDNAVFPAFAGRIKDADVVVRDLNAGDRLTLAYGVSAVTESEEKIVVTGEAAAGQDSPQDVTLNGTLSLEGGLPDNYRAYYKPFTGDVLAIGRAGFSAGYRLSMVGGTLSGGLSQGRLDLAGIRLNVPEQKGGRADPKVSPPAVSLETLSLSGVDLNLADRQVVIGRLTTGGGRIRCQKNRAGQINIRQGLDAMPAVAAANANPRTDAPASDSRPDWKLRINAIAVDDYGIGFTDETHREPVELKMSEITVRARPFGTDPDSAGHFHADMILNNRGTLLADGSLNLEDATAGMTLRLTRAELAPFQPYFSDYLNLLIRSGHVQASGDMSLDWSNTETMGISFRGDASVNGFASEDKAGGNAFFRCGALHFGGVDASVFPARVTMKEIVLTDFYHRAVLLADGRLNLSDIVVGRERAGTLEPAGKKPPGPMPEIAVETITVQGGHVNFTDYLTQPNFTANMTEIAGSVSGLSSLGSRPAVVRLKGRHGDHSPLTISGKIDPLKEVRTADLNLSFKNVELPRFNAYAGKYLGYEIEKGKLALDLTYAVKGNALRSSNHLFFDQFTLGDPVKSKHATRLPVELAIALLKNARGEIDLNIPVSGNLDDPDFSYGEVVVTTFKNLILSVVRAPFKFLGSLLGIGGEDLGTLAFAPGSSLIDAGSGRRLDQLAAVLKERPNLSLEIQGRYDTIQDDEELRHRQYMRLLAACLPDAAAAADLERGTLAPELRRAAVEAAYANAGFPKPREVSGKEKAISIDEKETLLLTGITVRETDLASLAGQRSTGIRDYLLGSGQIDPERIFIAAPQASAESGAGARQVKTVFKLK